MHELLLGPVPKSSSIAFIQVIDQASNQSDFNIGILAGHAHHPFAGKFARKSLSGRQFLPHQRQSPVLHRPFVIEIDDAAWLFLANPPRSTRGLPEREQVVSGLIKANKPRPSRLGSSAIQSIRNDGPRQKLPKHRRPA